MHTITKCSFLALALLALLCFPLSADQNAARWPDKLPGTWSGTWGNEYEHGTFVWIFGSDGRFQGTLHDSTYSTPDGTVQGELDKSGAIPSIVTFTYQYPQVGKFSGSGPMIMNGTRHLIGIVRLLKSDGSHLGDVAIDLTKDK